MLELLKKLGRDSEAQQQGAEDRQQARGASDGRVPTSGRNRCQRETSSSITGPGDAVGVGPASTLLTLSVID